MKKILFITCMSFVWSACSAQKNLSSPETIAANFFKAHENQGFNAAFETISSYTDVEIKKSLPSLKDTLSQLIDVVGKTYLGSELLFKKDISSSLCYRSYIVKYPLAPLRLTFIFYKPIDEWRIINFSLDGDMASEMQQLGRIYYIK